MAQHTETTKQKTGTTAGANTFAFAGPRIYIGPNAVKKGLRFGMGFKNGLPAEITAMCEKCPDLFELMVEPAKLNESRKQLTVKGSALNQALEAATAYLAGGGK